MGSRWEPLANDAAHLARVHAVQQGGLHATGVKSAAVPFFHIYVCMYVFMYVFIYMYITQDIFMHASVLTYIHTHKHTHKHAHIVG